MSDVEGQARALENRRSALERELRENAAALGAARALSEREAARAATAERERDALRGRSGAGAAGGAAAEPGR